MLELVNAILYVLKTAVCGAMYQASFHSWGTVYWYFSKWQDSGVLDEINACLVADCREHAQKMHPACVIIDTQSVKNAATGNTVGFDAGKLVKGRKRLVLINTLGNVLTS